MKDYTAKFLLLVIDFLTIIFTISLSFIIRDLIDDDFFSLAHNFPLSTYLTFYPFYLIPLLIFFYEGIYTYRYDFWHESRLILKGILFSVILIFAYLAMTKLNTSYSRFIIGFTFIFMAILIPLSKNISKKLLYKFGLWQKRAQIYGNDAFLMDEVFGNPYLGYVKPKLGEEPTTIFINSKDNNVHTLKELISSQIKNKHEVIFVPLIDDYDLTRSHIYELSNTRTNLVVFKNRLKDRYRLISKRISDFFLSLIIFPFLIPIMLLIAYRIKSAEPNSNIFFTQERLGKKGKKFLCYKFRTMYENGDDILQEYLKTHPQEKNYYARYHKYKNDPRITPIGHFLRRTSLDELPQIFNVFKQEMSFIGPRPYMLEEKEKIGNDLETIIEVRPGITGLWQVSGRSDVDFFSRIELDVWYIRNWNLWMDLVILIKTVKTVLFKDGAK